MTGRTALVVVDAQNDFMEGGVLAVPGARSTMAGIARFIDERETNYDSIIFTQKWHIDVPDYFSDNPDYVNTFPKHCVANSGGAAFTDEIVDTLNRLFDRPAKPGTPFRIFHRGMNGHGKYQPLDNFLSASKCQTFSEGMDTFLSGWDIDGLDIVGVGFDRQILDGALRAARFMRTRVLKHLTVSDNPTRNPTVTEKMVAAGVEIVDDRI